MLVTPAPDRRLRLWLLVAIVCAIGVGMCAVLRSRDSAGSTNAVPRSPAPDTPAAARQAAASPDSMQPPTVAASPSSSATDLGASVVGGPRRVSRERWTALHDALVRAWASPSPSPASAQVAGGDSPPSGALNKEYIRDAIRGIVPLIRECYDLALREAPDLEGRLVVEFAIGGERDVGGIVEEASIAERSTLRHPVLDECVRETIYTVELPAPEGGGRVNVMYPFVFSRGSEPSLPGVPPQPT